MTALLLTSKESAERKRTFQDNLATSQTLLGDIRQIFAQASVAKTVQEELQSFHAQMSADIDQKMQEIKVGITTATQAQPKPSFAAITAKVKTPSGKSIVPSKTHRVLIKPDAAVMENFTTSDDTRSSAFRAVTPASLGLQINKVMRSKGKCIIVESSDNKIEGLINNADLKAAGLSCTRLGKFAPRLLIKRVPSELKSGDVKADLIAQNLYGMANLEQEQEHIRVITALSTKRRDGTPSPFADWVVEVTPKIRQFIMRDTISRVFLSWASCPVRDHLRLNRCYKCQKFGHHSKDCQSEAACAKCAGANETKDCAASPEIPSKCINCSIWPLLRRF